ncbi:UNVERIFIED_CONTAM: hypothetical protein HDU68_004769 [Siphonaria sp. JEL0065]|nr:hypothetical protein HDU68_004769 [Siphonaria sp. JEL0065]
MNTIISAGPSSTPVGASPMRPLKSQKDKSKQRLLGASAKNINYEKPMDPTDTNDAVELQRLRATKWYLRERALKIDEKNAKMSIEMQKAQESSGSLSWDLLRPLSRDPVFGKYIQTLNEFGHELGFINASDADLKPTSATATTTSTPETPNTKKGKPPTNKNIIKSNLSGIKCSVGDADLDKLILMIEKSVFRAKRKGDCAIPGNALQDKNETVYEFGKPSILKDGEAEEYAESFRQLVHFGEEVTESIGQIQKDKASFSNITPPRGKGRNLNLASYLPKPIEVEQDMNQALGFSKPPTPKEPRKNPSKQRRQDFLKWQQNGQTELKKALKARLLDRLEASKDNSRLLKVLNVLQEDIKVDFYLHSAADPKHWMSVLPHIWVKDSDELLKELDNPLLKLNARRNMNSNAPVVTAASIYKERAMITALVNVYQKTSSIAGHQRRDSIIAACRRLDEYQKMMEGKDIVAERLATADLFSESHLEALFGKKQPLAPPPPTFARRVSVAVGNPNASLVQQRENSAHGQPPIRQMSIKAAVRFHEKHMNESLG